MILSLHTKEQNANYSAKWFAWFCRACDTIVFRISIDHELRSFTIVEGHWPFKMTQKCRKSSRPSGQAHEDTACAGFIACARVERREDRVVVTLEQSCNEPNSLSRLTLIADNDDSPFHCISWVNTSSASRYRRTTREILESVANDRLAAGDRLTISFDLLNTSRHYRVRW